MNRLKRSTAVWRVLMMLAFSSPAALQLHADAIFFNDGNVLVVEKAWVEGDEVKYKTSRGVQSLPKSQVREIQEQAPSAPTGSHWGNAVTVGTQAQTSPASAVDGATSGAAGFSKEALTRLRENLRVDPSDRQAKAELLRALSSVASLQLTEGDLPAAMSTLEEALSLDKRNLEILSNLAVIHLRMSDYRAAEDLLKTCLEIDSSNQQIHYLLGEAYYGQEKISQAISQWTAGLRLGPHPEMAKRLEKARQEARVHDDLGVLQDEHFILRYDRKVSDQYLGQEILATLEKLYRQLTSEISSRPPATIAVILYPDRTYFDITRVASWTGALFDGKIRVPTKGLTSVTPDLTATLLHELTHSFIAALPGRGCPAWFNEGVAQLEEGKSAASDRKALAQLSQANHLIPLKHLEETFIGLPEDAADVAYAEGLSAVEYLVSQFGKSAVRNVLDLMAQNYNFENAFKTALKRSISEFETSWQQDLTR